MVLNVFKIIGCEASMYWVSRAIRHLCVDRVADPDPYYQIYPDPCNRIYPDPVLTGSGPLTKALQESGFLPNKLFFLSISFRDSAVFKVRPLSNLMPKAGSNNNNSDLIRIKSTPYFQQSVYCQRLESGC